MAFNPSPKVRAAADLAKQFGASHSVILLFDDTQGTLEYASYGRDRERCDEAKVFAEIAFNAIMQGQLWTEMKP